MATRYRYGPARQQVCSLSVPVIVLIHGGFWRALDSKIVMTRLVRAVVAEGWAA